MLPAYYAVLTVLIFSVVLYLSVRARTLYADCQGELKDAGAMEITLYCRTDDSGKIFTCATAIRKAVHIALNVPVIKRLYLCRILRSFLCSIRKMIT